MKVIAIIEVPEGGKGKWYIDGEIRYTENESLMKKFDVEMIPLKPLPKQFATDEILMAKDVKTAIEMRAYNDCLEEIVGETE